MAGALLGATLSGCSDIYFDRRDPISVVSADPLNFQGILTPEKRVAATVRQEVLVG